MKTLVTKYQSQVSAFLWRRFLRIAGDVISAAEDWIHGQELKLRAPIAAPAFTVVTDEFQIAASRAREKAHQRAARPRLRYQGGQFVRVA